MDTERKVELLLGKHFHWGKQGYPPDPGSDVERRERVVAWLKERTGACGDAALALVAVIRAVIEEANESIQTRDGRRFFARIDSTELVKSPESILDKMVRDWEPETRDAPPVDFDALPSAMGDIGRFRIVVSFLSDLSELKSKICHAFGGAGAALSPGQQRLRDDFILTGGRFKDTVNLAPTERKKGERSLKASFSVQHGDLKALVVELQIVTQLQEAWDKKDHFLIYEPRRQGRPPSANHEREIFAMSELLYVADLTFERLRQAIRTRRPRRRP